MNGWRIDLFFCVCKSVRSICHDDRWAHSKPIERRKFQPTNTIVQQLDFPYQPYQSILVPKQYF